MMTTPYQASNAMRPVRADYSQWSIEELWELATQLRVSGARTKTRRELIDLFAVPTKAARG